MSTVSNLLAEKQAALRQACIEENTALIECNDCETLVLNAKQVWKTASENRTASNDLICPAFLVWKGTQEVFFSADRRLLAKSEIVYRLQAEVAELERRAQA
jgi:hypothetical protein